MTANLSQIGGSATQTLYDDGTHGDVTAGNNVFSFSATVSAGTTPNAYNLPVTITDAQSRTGSASISLTVTAAPTPPTGTGAAQPGNVEVGESALLTVTVAPGGNPTSTGINVTADLTSIGGSATQQFYNDATHGDQTAGDSIFSYSATVANGTTPGSKSLTATISDAQARSSMTSIALNVLAADTTHIYEIQGSGNTSPLVGNTVTTSGIITGIKQGSSGGFFIQDPAGDGDTQTSDGIFVFMGSSLPAAVAIGNRVQVTGKVQEFIPSADPNQHSVTELSSSPTVTLISTSQPLPTPVTISSSDTLVNELDNLERYEGMLVTVPSLTVVGATQGSINEPNATVSSTGVFFGVVTGVARPFREPGISAYDPTPAGAPPRCAVGVPTSSCIPTFDENPERIRVDSDAQPGTTAVDVPAGTVLTNVTGALDYSFRAYTLLPSSTITVPGALATAVAVPTPYPTEFTVASFNMERFFDTLDDPTKDDPVLTQAAFDKRLNKASLAIRNVMRSPDVIGVEEMENLSTLQAVATKLNDDTVAVGGANPSYVAYLDEGNDVGGIDVGFLVKTSRVAVVDVTQYNKDETYDVPGGGSALLNDRPPLVLRANATSAGGASVPITVIVNHLRSLGCIDADVNAGSAASCSGGASDGPRVREKRRKQAESLANLIQSFQTADPNARIISLGDYNAFSVNDGYVDVMDTIKGTPAASDQVVLASPDLVNPDLTDLVDTLPADGRYSYNFDGDAQALDHILVNTNAQASLTRFAYARNDSDFPVKYYEDGTRSERLSDHDMPVAYFTLYPQAQAGQFIISEFRFGMTAPQVQATSNPLSKNSPALTHLSAKGTASSTTANPSDDEFIELYNNTNAPLVVSTNDGSAGWSLVAADGNVRFTIPNGTTIPARGHFLATNSNGYSLNSYPSGDNAATSPTPVATTATGDITYTQDIPEQSGIAIFRTANANNFMLDNRLDAVGAESITNPLYKESPGLMTTSSSSSSQYSFIRDLRSGVPQDTNHNDADFFFVSTNNTTTFAVALIDGTAVDPTNHLGAPGPENLTSPINRTDAIKPLLVNPCQPSSASPNRERVGGAYTDPAAPTGSDSGTYALGYLDIRRRFNNSTNATVTRLRFRIVEITTLPAPPGTADLRVLTSPNVSVSTCSGTTTVKGLTLETVPEQSTVFAFSHSKIGGLTPQMITASSKGGGWNSTVSAGTINLNGGLAPNGNIDVNFRLGVAQSGSFRFLIIVEALP
jgi:predicted extracellular nuclease